MSEETEKAGEPAKRVRLRGRGVAGLLLRRLESYWLKSKTGSSAAWIVMAERLRGEQGRIIGAQLSCILWDTEPSWSGDRAAVCLRLGNG